MSKFIDLAGQKFKRLTVIHRINNDKWGNAKWLCKCDCGNTTPVGGYSLISGNTKSCGCLNISKNKTHELSYSRIYNIWHCLRKRCTLPTDKNYKNYGGAGVTVMFTCFEDFAQWTTVSKYAEHLTIDRIDNNGPYSRDNCRWATPKEQATNRSTNVNITNNATGKTLCVTEWSRRLGGSKTLVSERLKRGWDYQKAITLPVRKYPPS